MSSKIKKLIIILFLVFCSCKTNASLSNYFSDAKLFDFCFQVDDIYIDSNMLVGDVIRMINTDEFKYDIDTSLVKSGDISIYRRDIDTCTLEIYKNDKLYFNIEYFNPYSYDVHIEECKILNIIPSNDIKNNCYYLNGIGYKEIITYNVDKIYDIFNDSLEEYSCEKRFVDESGGYSLQFYMVPSSSRVDYYDETETMGFNNIKKYVFIFDNNDNCIDFYIDNHYEYFWVTL